LLGTNPRQLQPIRNWPAKEQLPGLQISAFRFQMDPRAQDGAEHLSKFAAIMLENSLTR